MITEQDHIKAVRERLIRQRGSLEAEVAKLQERIQELDDTISALDRAPRLLKQTTPVEKLQEVIKPVKKRARRGEVTGWVIHCLREMPGEDADKVNVAELRKRVNQNGLKMRYPNLYSLLYKYAKTQKPLILHVRGEGFIFNRSCT